eukprot:jgi/Hompol1/4848/HPOL_003945-RA
MAKVIRTPITMLEGSTPLASLTGGPGTSAGEHTVRFGVNIDYTLGKSPVCHLANTKQPTTPTRKSKKRQSTDEYKRMYITYSIGGQIEGKDFLAGLYQKPTEFIIWEIQRTEDRERDGIAAVPQLIKSNAAHTAKTLPGNFTSTIAGAYAHAATFTAHQTTTKGKLQKRAAHEFEFVETKLPMSLAQTGLTRKQKHHNHNKPVMIELDDIPPLNDEEVIEPEHAQPRVHHVTKSKPVADFELKSAFEGGAGDHFRAGQDMVDNILHRLTRRQSSSTPDISAALKQGAYEFQSIGKRTNSDSPPLDRYRPGSPLHRFLTDDFGVKQQESSARPTSRGSMREGAHPHHFNHPEKHVPADVPRPLVRSRSSSSLTSLHQLHPKTPPSPHHHDHPLTILAPRGRVKGGGGSFKKDTESNFGGGGSKSKRSNKTVEKESSFSSKADDISNKGRSFFRNRGAEASFKGAASQQDGSSERLNTTARRAIEESRHIRWGNATPGIRMFNWSDLPVEEAERRANDQVIDIPGEKPLMEKRKGEFTHVPLGRIILDVAGFYFDILETRARLNPMSITIGTADGMPDEPIGFSELDEKCLPVSAKFRVYSDPFIHSAIAIDQPHGHKITFESQHLILIGLMDAERLRDHMSISPMIVEVHDRDHKLPQDLAKINAGLRDDGVITSSMNPVNPFGVASFSASCLAFAPLGHVVIVTSSRNGSVAKAVQQAVTNINMDTLKIVPGITRSDLVLATHQLSEEQRNNPSLDILTGYDIFDSQVRVMFIEGLVDGGIKALLSALDHYTYTSHHFQSTDSFDIVAKFDAHPTRAGFGRHDAKQIHLYTWQAMIYLENLPVAVKMVSFPTKSMIFALLQSHGRFVHFEDSIPVGEFSVEPAIRPVVSVMHESTPNSESPSNDTAKLQTHMAKPRYGRRGEPLNYQLGYATRAEQTLLDQDNHSEIRRMQLRHLREPNFVNINSKRDDSYIPDVYPRTMHHEVFNYSMQTFSTTQQQLSNLRDRMAKDSTTYYAYCEPYFSQMVSPVDIESALKDKEKESRSRWKTKSGFWAGPFVEQSKGTGSRRAIEICENTVTFYLVYGFRDPRFKTIDPKLDKKKYHAKLGLAQDTQKK